MLAGSIAAGALKGDVFGHDAEAVATLGESASKKGGITLHWGRLFCAAVLRHGFAQGGNVMERNASRKDGWTLEVGAYEGEARARRNAQATLYDKR